VKRLEAKEYAAAAIAFEKSLAIKESLPAVFNLAVAYRGAGRYHDAKLKLERFVALLESSHPAEGALTRARALLDEVTKKLARVRINIRGGADRVLIGSLELPGKDGEQVIEVDPGKYQVVAKREGFAPVSATVNAIEGELTSVSLDAAKKPLDGSVRVTASPDVAEIRLDGAVAGSGRFARALSPGPHTVEVVAVGHRTETRQIVVEPGRELTLDIALELEAAPPITSEWWFWAGVVVVVAGAATGVALATRKGDCDGGSLNTCVFE
jgi:hypothetical protein